MSTALRSTLQKDVFAPDGDRLMAVAHVKNEGKKKKKEMFLCLVVSTETSISIKLALIKASDDGFKKKEHFKLQDVTIVDGIHPRRATTDFEMNILDKHFKLSCATYDDKENFIKQMFKMVNLYLPVQKPDFINVSLPVDEPIGPMVLNDLNDSIVKENFGDYQPISAKEESDFRKMLDSYQLTIGDAELFSSHLTERVLELDEANMESIRGSEHTVPDVINAIDSALDREVRMIEEILNDFDGKLAFMNESVELMEEKDSLANQEKKNQRLLLEELTNLINSIDSVCAEDLFILENASLNDPAAVNACTHAAKAIQALIKEQSPLSQMAAYASHLNKLNKVTDVFVDKLLAHLSPLFSNSTGFSESDAYELSLRKQSQRFHALNVFSDLILWLKQTRHGVYQATIQKYVESTKIVYKRDLANFFDTLNRHLLKGASISEKAKASTLSKSTLSSDRSLSSRFTDEENHILQLLDTALFEVSSVVETEQKFCTRFFHVHTDIFSSIETQSLASNDSNSRLMDKQLTDQVRIIVAPLFDAVNSHLEQFAASCCRQNAFAAISLFVSMSKKIGMYQNTASYFSVIYGRLMVLVKRQFDQFMEDEMGRFRDVKLVKRTRIGILDSIDRFYTLAVVAEKAILGAERRNDLDRWYIELTNHLALIINTVAMSQYSKSPPTVVRFENFHHFYSKLSELKIECLDSKRKETKKLYQENIKTYVKEHMGRPLEKIHQFFERIERAMDSGMSAEEVGYQTQFSKNELKKVISAYPGREIKKGLEQLYKKMEKHLIEASPLLQVVWRNMQDEFLKQIKHYQTLIGRCYPSSKIDLEVTIPDVLQYFSEIAQQH
uniref:Sec3-PIP2_bind domain-containing protein n=1 Tax=Rhabditophanes sp. KR3021 TaxID=114890 RepID=A0AC35UGF2_9BILA